MFIGIHRRFLLRRLHQDTLWRRPLDMVRDDEDLFQMEE